MSDDVIIIGAGAAGLMCAREAGRRGRHVRVLDKARQPGRKILISGGGRCNFTNLNIEPRAYLSENPHFCKSALARYTQWQFMDLLAAHGLSWTEKTLGQLFCDQKAGAVLNMLLEECTAAGVRVETGVDIRQIRKPDSFIITTADGDYRADSLVIATGGPSIPRMGSTDFGVRVARRFGLKTVPFRPGLVPLILSEADRNGFYRHLAGCATEVVAHCNGQSFRENLLFTHRGLSGPAILQISSWWREGDHLSLDFMPGRDASEWLLASKASMPDKQLKNVLARILPRRLAAAFAERQWQDIPLRRFTDKRLRHIGEQLNRWPVAPVGTEGLRTAEVCVGGVSTSELSSRTMEANRIPGLYFIGETVDVTGQLGGYNFQWAWSSGWCAGQVV